MSIDVAARYGFIDVDLLAVKFGYCSAMTTTVTIYDETTAGARSAPLVLQFPSESMTVRELIRERVYQEVSDFNAKRGQEPVFRGLVQPTAAEVALNGYRMKEPSSIEWRAQFDLALQAFEANQIIVLVHDVQMESLDQTFTVQPSSIVTFLKLTPLVGG